MLSDLLYMISSAKLKLAELKIYTVEKWKLKKNYATLKCADRIHLGSSGRHLQWCHHVIWLCVGLVECHQRLLLLLQRSFFVVLSVMNYTRSFCHFVALMNAATCSNNTKAHSETTVIKFFCVLSCVLCCSYLTEDNDMLQDSTIKNNLLHSSTAYWKQQTEQSNLTRSPMSNVHSTIATLSHQYTVSLVS